MSWSLLIIEDDADIAESLAEVFAARGFRVEVAGNGKEALERVRRSGQRPDAILLDLLMPVMDGRAFLRDRTKEPLLAAVPVIVITAQPASSESATEIYARFDKPLALRQLVDTVERACHRDPPGGSAAGHGGRSPSGDPDPDPDANTSAGRSLRAQPTAFSSSSNASPP